jgi:hypothetical protein
MRSRTILSAARTVQHVGFCSNDGGWVGPSWVSWEMWAKERGMGNPLPNPAAGVVNGTGPGWWRPTEALVGSPRHEEIYRESSYTSRQLLAST